MYGGMSELIFKDNKHGDILLENAEGELKLRTLLGMKMEGKTKLIGRISGIYDIFTSLGSHIHHQTVKKAEIEDDIFRAEIDLYEGRMLYTTEWHYDRNLGFITRKDRLENVSEEKITLHKAVARYIFAYDEFEAYTQNTRWCYENMGEWNKVNFGGVSLASEGGRTTQGATPFLALRNKTHEGAAFHIVPNGNWKIAFKTVSLGCSQAGEYAYELELGQSDDHFAFDLQPGQTFEFPELYVQKLINGNLADTAANLQRFFLKTDTGRFRIEHPVVYNPWYDHYALLDMGRLKDHIKRAKELGCEIFEIDAGWYGSQEGDWWAQCGDWQEETIGAFYGKMSEFADYVRAQGLKFGLWMEPERIGEKTPIYQKHPEYFGPGEEFHYPKLQNPEVYDYMYKEIAGLIEKYQLCWMKMDFNYELGEDDCSSEFYLYYQAWYRLLNEIKENYPETFIEACAAGGERNDIHTSTTYDGHFLSDNTNSFDVHFTFEQCCLRLPHYRMIKWLVVSPGAKISLYDSATLDKIPTVITPQKPGAGWDEYERISPEFACQLTMCGMVGLSGDYIGLTDEQVQVFKDHIAFYKKYRRFFKESVLYLSGDPKNVGDRDGFSYLQYNKEETDEHLVFSYCFAPAYKTNVIRLKNMSEDAAYVIEDAVSGEKICECTGEELMYRGIEADYPSRNSGKIWMIRKK